MCVCGPDFQIKQNQVTLSINDHVLVFFFLSAGMIIRHACLCITLGKQIKKKVPTPEFYLFKKLTFALPYYLISSLHAGELL